MRGAALPGGGHRQLVRAAAYCLALVVLAVALRLVYGPADPGYDARFALVWGRELAHLQSPDYGSVLSPTSHPLANLVGLVASLFGGSGPAVLNGLSWLALAGVGIAAFAVGRRTFGVVSGIAFAAILLTRPLLVGETFDASIDIPFLALVLAALALELQPPAGRRPAAVLIVLALAGLLRPEAWLLSIAYAAYAGRSLPRSAALRLAALALSAPVLWLLFDAVTTGHPFSSLTKTQDLAGTLQRERGLHSAVSTLPVNLQTIVGSEVAWAGLAAGAVALFLFQDRARLPIVVLALGLLGFVALGVANLPLLTRYLLVPSAMLGLLAGAAFGAFEWLRLPGRWRLAGWLAGAGAALALAGGAAAARDGIDLNRERVDAGRAEAHALARVADAAGERGLVRRCAPVQAMTHRAIPELAYRLDMRPSEVRVTLPADARRGLVFTGPAQTLIGDVGLLPGVTIRSQQLVPPRAFRRVATTPWWTLAARC